MTGLAAWTLYGVYLLELIAGLFWSRLQERRLLARGGRPCDFAGEWLVTPWLLAYYAGLALLFANAPLRWTPVSPFFLAGFLGAQALHLWAVLTLGPRWCRRLIVLPGQPPLREGPYRFLRHPIYAALVAECLCLPAVFARPLFGLAMAGVLAALLAWRACIEVQGFAIGRSQQSH